MHEIIAGPVHADTFAPFGTLLGAVSGTLTPWNGRLAATAVIEMLQAPGPTSRHVHVIDMLERHPRSTQAFFPIGTGAYLVVVAGTTADSGPDLAGLHAFRVPQSTVVQYHAAVWHAPITAIEPTGLFAMHVHKDGSPDDAEFIGIPPVAVRLEDTGVPTDFGRPTRRRAGPLRYQSKQEMS